MPHTDAPSWAGDGLHFSCTMCGACCTGPPGYVLYTDDDLARMCARLGLSREAFLKQYTNETIEGQSLNEIETEHGYDCVFLDRTTVPGKAVCSIHEDRPTQCRTFPWWPEHTETKRAWERLGKECEGVNRVEEGSFIPRDEIAKNLKEQDASRGFE